MPDTSARDEPSTPLFQHIYNPDGCSWSWARLAFDLRDRNTLPQLHTAADKDWSFAPARLVLGAAEPVWTAGNHTFAKVTEVMVLFTARESGEKVESGFSTIPTRQNKWLGHQAVHNNHLMTQLRPA